MSHSSPGLQLCRLVPSLLAAVGLVAEEGPGPMRSLPTIEIVGSAQDDAVELPGTATVLDDTLIDRHRYANIVKIMRLVPGASVVDEDGYGLRPNIGLRGVNPVRSNKVLVLEDGVPIAPNPYNDPSLYVAPAFARYAAVEVVKGSGQILHGPHTVAGVVNFKSRPVTMDNSGSVDVSHGTDDTRRALINVNALVNDDLGFGADLFLFDSDGFRPYESVTQYEVVPKLAWFIDDRNSIEFKISATGEKSNTTYQGLSRQDYDRDAYDRYDFTAQDVMDAERYHASVRHRFDFSETGSLTSTVYGQHTDRNWTRGEQTFNAGTGSYEGRTVTDNGFERDRYSRAREYSFVGAETRFNDHYELGPIPMTLDLGTRVHHEGQVNRSVDFEATTGERAVRSRVERDSTALAAWAQANFEVTEGLHLIPGVRVEHVRIRSQRTHNDYVETNDPEGTSSLVEVLPGFGFTWQALEHLQFYGGVHRGFSPPSYSQAIASDGEDNELDSEISWNYEIGLRAQALEHLKADFAIFYIDWENIIAQGVAGGPQINGGESTHYGAELLLDYDLGAAADWAVGVPLRLAATWLRAEYSSDVFSNATLVAEDGNQREYSPDVQLSFSAGVEGFGPRRGFHSYLTLTYVDEQYTDGMNTEDVSANGGVGKIDATVLLDLSAKWRPEDSAYEIYLNVHNLLDNEYVAYRRGSQGSVAGAPFQASVGFSTEF